MIDTKAQLKLLAEAFRALEAGFEGLDEGDGDVKRMRAVLLAAAERLHDNYPYHHPLYIGQMLKPPHPVARLAYALAMSLNPNNHALDGGRASSAMEKEAVAGIARMFGWETHLGHLCGGGTMANFEALWIARELRPALAVAASTQAHYTHARLSAVLDMPYKSIAVDASGRMDLKALEQTLGEGLVGTVVATMGTTAAGVVDPLPEILELARRTGARVHADAAYGGYFSLASNLEPATRRAFEAMSDVDSIVIDPHKHGLQPYGCGCVLFRDPAVGRLYKHDSPYTYFSSEELHLGEISLECSRPGAAAVALWTTMEMLPLVYGGEFAQMLEAGRAGALELHARLVADFGDRFAPIFAPELDIVVWAVRAKSASESSGLAYDIFDAAAEHDLHLAVATFPRAMVESCGAIETWDESAVVCLRACVMKPEHREWMDEITLRLRRAADEVAGRHGA